MSNDSIFDTFHFDLIHEILQRSSYQDILNFSLTCRNGVSIIKNQKFWSRLYKYYQYDEADVIKYDMYHYINVAQITSESFMTILYYDASHIYQKVCDQDQNLKELAYRCVTDGKHKILSVVLDKLSVIQSGFEKDIKFGTRLLRHHCDRSYFKNPKCGTIIIKKCKFYIDPYILNYLASYGNYDLYDSPNLDIHYCDYQRTERTLLNKLLDPRSPYGFEFSKKSILCLYQNPNFNKHLLNRECLLYPEVRKTTDRIPELSSDKLPIFLKYLVDSYPMLSFGMYSNNWYVSSTATYIESLYTFDDRNDNPIVDPNKDRFLQRLIYFIEAVMLLHIHHDVFNNNATISLLYFITRVFIYKVYKIQKSLLHCDDPNGWRVNIVLGSTLALNFLSFYPWTNSWINSWSKIVRNIILLYYTIYNSYTRLINDGYPKCWLIPATCINSLSMCYSNYVAPVMNGLQLLLNIYYM